MSASLMVVLLTASVSPISQLNGSSGYKCGHLKETKGKGELVRVSDGTRVVEPALDEVGTKSSSDFTSTSALPGAMCGGDVCARTRPCVFCLCACTFFGGGVDVVLGTGAG